MIRIRFVARHLVAKADDRVAEEVTDNISITAVASTTSAAIVTPFCACVAYSLRCVCCVG